MVYFSWISASFLICITLMNILLTVQGQPLCVGMKLFCLVLLSSFWFSPMCILAFSDFELSLFNSTSLLHLLPDCLLIVYSSENHSRHSNWNCLWVDTISHLTGFAIPVTGYSVLKLLYQIFCPRFVSGKRVNLAQYINLTGSF